MKVRVLVTPLDWGLGHATRCIPIIQALLRKNCDVVLGGDGNSLLLLRNEFPQLKYYELASYNPVYTASSSLAWKILQQLFKFIFTIRKEHRQTERIVNDERIHLVISDNRYGCWSKQVRSIFITHQINVLLPGPLKWIEPVLAFLMNFRIKKFTQCWVPDWQGKNSLTGRMSQSDRPFVRYIGPLSRFEHSTNLTSTGQILAILSGPEPQRTLLENILLASLPASEKTSLLIRGIPGKEKRKLAQHVTVMDFADTHELQEVIGKADIIISRSGYSTIMDLVKIGGKKKIIFVPTPGQTEQEYLAEKLYERGIVYYVKQEEFDLEKALAGSEKLNGFVEIKYHNELDAVLEETLTGYQHN